MTLAGYTIKRNNKLARSEPCRIPEPFGAQYRMLLSFQAEAYELASRAGLAILCMPMGSGKTTIGGFAVVSKLRRSKSRKGIIAFPQLAISKNFRFTQDKANTTFLFRSIEQPIDSKNAAKRFHQWAESLPDSEKHEWIVDSDLTRDGSDESKINQFIKFLRSKRKSVNGRILICTHATLVAVYRRLHNEKNLKLLKNLFLVIDEAHHILDDDVHGLGSVFRWALQHHEDQDIDILLMTATPFRGDCRQIMNEEDWARFQEYKLPFDRHLAHMPKDGLKSFDFGFLFYDLSDGYCELLRNEFATGIGKTIIYLNYRNSPKGHYPPSSKPQEVRNIVETIVRSQGWTGPIVRENIHGTAIFRVKVGKDRWIRIVDAVDNTGHVRQTVKKHIIEKDSLNEDESFADIIISLGIGKEGFDWKFCDRVVVLGARNSLTELVQTSGRSLRYVPGKSHASIRMFIPCIIADIKDRESLRTNLSDVFNAISMSMLMYDIMEPVMIKVPTGKNGGTREISGSELLSEIFPSDMTRNSFQEMVTTTLASESFDNSRLLTINERTKIIADIMRYFNVRNVDIDNYARSMARYFRIIAKRNYNRFFSAIRSQQVLRQLRETGLDKVYEIASFAFASSVTNSENMKDCHDAWKRINTNSNGEEWPRNFRDYLKFWKKRGGGPNDHPSSGADDPREVELAVWGAKQRNIHSPCFWKQEVAT